jgi:hypothetical protein
MTSVGVRGVRGPTREWRWRTPWRHGTARDHYDGLLVSYTEFTPDTMLDLPRIYLAAERLRRACSELEGAIGLTIYWQPLHRRGGSLSAWTSRDSLRRFVTLPYHLEIMRRYRTRGTVRSTEWWAESLDIGEALAQGQRALDGG